MLLNRPTSDGRPQLESKILAAALRQSLSRRDTAGILLAHSELTKLMAAHGQDFPGLEQLQSGHVPIPALRFDAPPEVAPGQQPSDNKGGESTEAAPPYQGQEISVAVAGGIAAGTTPMDYLDFDDSPSKSDETDNLITSGGEELPSGRLSGRVAPDPESRSYYSRLAATPIDSAEVVHLCYIRAIRMLLRSQYLDGKANALNAHEFRKHLRNLGIAYNILYDVSTRLDYDLRLLGLREPLSGKHLTVPEDAKTDANGKAKLSLVEIVVLSRTFGADTLLAAVDAARSRPEAEFWEYLAQTGAFMQVDFEALHLGARLMRHGLVSVVQFEQAFQSVRSSGYSLEAILVHNGWVDAEQLQLLNEEARESAEPAFQFVEVKVDNAPRPAHENIKVGGNLPSWASHMDWGGEEGSAAESGEERVEELSAPPAASAEQAATSQILDYLAPQTSFEPEPLPDNSQTAAFVPQETATPLATPQTFTQTESAPAILPPDIAESTISLDSVVLDFSSAGDEELPADAEPSPDFAETAALVDWELPATPQQGADQDAASETDWSIVTPPAIIAGQYAPEPEPARIVEPTSQTDWSATSAESTPLAEAAPVQPPQTMEHQLAPGATLGPDPMESLPKPMTRSSWEEAVAQALVVEPTGTPASKSPDTEATAVASETVLEAIGEAPGGGGSWASAVEQILGRAEKGTDTQVEAGQTEKENVQEIPATIELPKEEHPPALTTQNAGQETKPETAGPATESTDVAPEREVTPEAASAPEATPETIPDSASPVKDARRTREKPARKPRSRREAKNLIQLSKLGADSRTHSDEEASPDAPQTTAVQTESAVESQADASQDTVVSEPEAMPETDDTQEAPPSEIPNTEREAQPVDALSFFNMSESFVSPLPDAESRDQLLFGDPFSNLDSSSLLTGDARSSDDPTTIEPPSSTNAQEPVISFAPPSNQSSELPAPVADVSTERPASPEQLPQPTPVVVPVAEPLKTSATVSDAGVIDATPDEPPGWSRYKLFFGESEKALPVSGTIARIGRNRQSVDIAIQEPAVSREHCQLEIGAEGVFLKDLTSRHGTYIVRGKVEFRTNHDNPMKLEHGDCIRLGKPGAPALEWVDTQQQYDENAPTDSFAAIPGTTDYESLRDTGPRQPKAFPLKPEVLTSLPNESDDEEVAKPEDSGINKVDSNLAAAATAMAMSSGLGSDSIEAIMAAMLGPTVSAQTPSSVPRPAPEEQPPQQDDADLAAAAAAMAASSGLSKDAIDSIIAAMRKAKPSSPREADPSSSGVLEEVLEAEPAANTNTGIPSPPEPPHSTEPLVVEVPLEPIAVGPVESNSPDKQTDVNGSPDGEKSSNGSRTRATADNPYADIDALMAAIDAEVATARKVIDEDDRKRKRLRQS